MHALIAHWAIRRSYRRTTWQPPETLLLTPPPRPISGTAQCEKIPCGTNPGISDGFPHPAVCRLSPRAAMAFTVPWRRCELDGKRPGTATSRAGARQAPRESLGSAQSAEAVVARRGRSRIGYSLAHGASPAPGDMIWAEPDAARHVEHCGRSECPPESLGNSATIAATKPVSADL